MDSPQSRSKEVNLQCGLAGPTNFDCVMLQKVRSDCISTVELLVRYNYRVCCWSGIE